MNPNEAKDQAESSIKRWVQTLVDDARQYERTRISDLVTNELEHCTCDTPLQHLRQRIEILGVGK